MRSPAAGAIALVFVLSRTSTATAQVAPAASLPCRVAEERVIAHSPGPMLDARIAASTTDTLVTWSYRSADDVEALGTNIRTARWSGNRVPARPAIEQIEASSSACMPDPLVTPVVWNGAVTLLSYGVPAEPSTLDEFGHDHDFALESTPRTDIAYRHIPDAITGAACPSRAYMIAHGVESVTTGGRCTGENPVAVNADVTLRAFTFGGPGPTSSVLYTEPRPLLGSPRHMPVSPAIAVRPSGGGIAVFRSAGALLAVLFDNAGVPQAPAITLARGEIGAPAVTLLAGTAHVVWASRADAQARWQLWSTTVSEGGVPRESPVQITSGVRDAFAPSTTTQRARLILAWTEGDSVRGAGVIRAGSSTTGLDGAASAAAAIGASAASSNRREPKLAATADRLWLVVQEFNRGDANGALGVARLRCDGP